MGAKIRVFGSVTKFDENPQKLPKEQKTQAIEFLSTLDPEQLVPHKADSYHRWFGTNWAFIEKGGKTGAGEWTSASDARLKKFVDYGPRAFSWLNSLTHNAAHSSQGEPYASPQGVDRASSPW